MARQNPSQPQPDPANVPFAAAVTDARTLTDRIRRFFAEYAWFIVRNVIGWLLIVASPALGVLVPGPGGLPIFLIGLFPMLMLSLLGPAGLIILGILVASAGLTDMLDANGTFSEQIIVHGYARGSERTGQRTALRSEMRFASVMIASGAALAIAGIAGLVIS